MVSELAKIEKDLIWEKIVVGNKDLPISKLIKNLDNADWVGKGRSYIGKDGVCPFCQQKTITTNLEQQLNTFFKGEYESDKQHIKKLIEKYQSVSDKLISDLKNTTTNEYMVSIGELDISKYNTLLESLTLLFATTLEKMLLKEKEPSKKITLMESQEKINELSSMILDANTNIKNHNDVVDNYEHEKKKLINDVWEFLLTEHKTLIAEHISVLSSFEKAKEGINKSIIYCEKQLRELNNKISKAEENITSVKPTIDAINRSLTACGFKNFQIVSSDSKTNFYQIQRLDGTLATSTLSEGEETFISFLYFFQFAKGSLEKTKVSSKKILVLDDPISSLDSTVLYVVSSMVKSLINEIRSGKSDVEQIFILTHNVFFHKEASFLDMRIKELNDVNYWTIRKDNMHSSVSAFGKKNPIKNSYQLLWQELKKIESSVSIQNTMRKIIEYYFNILGTKINEEIINSFDLAEDKMIVRSLISWINDGSHSIPDDLYIDSYTDSTERYKAIFEKIFINMGHKAHYDMMMMSE